MRQFITPRLQGILELGVCQTYERARFPESIDKIAPAASPESLAAASSSAEPPLAQSSSPQSLISHAKPWGYLAL